MGKNVIYKCKGCSKIATDFNVMPPDQCSCGKGWGGAISLAFDNPFRSLYDMSEAVRIFSVPGNPIPGWMPMEKAGIILDTIKAIKDKEE